MFLMKVKSWALTPDTNLQVVKNKMGFFDFRISQGE